MALTPVRALPVHTYGIVRGTTIFNPGARCRHLLSSIRAPRTIECIQAGVTCSACPVKARKSPVFGPSDRPGLFAFYCVACGPLALRP